MENRSTIYVVHFTKLRTFEYNKSRQILSRHLTPNYKDIQVEVEWTNTCNKSF